MGKERIVDRIYAAFKDAAGGRSEVALTRAVMHASAATSMLPGLIRRYIEVMQTVGMIHSDGVTVWLTQDYGPRVQRPGEFEAARKREIEKMKRARPKASKRADRILAAEERKAEKKR